MAKVKLVLQGRDKKENHKNILTDILEKERIEDVLISVAFVRSEGVSLIEKSLKGINEKANVFVGIRNGITSKQALKKLLECNVNLYVVDTGKNGTLFHPKIYMAKCKNKAFAIIGSSNLTVGGLMTNVEGSGLLELDLTDNGDEAFVEDVRESFKGFINEYPLNVYKIEKKSQVDELCTQGKVINEKKELPVKSYGSNTSEEREITPSMKLNIERPKKNKNQEKNKKENKKILITIDGTDIIGFKTKEVWESKKLTERDLSIPSGDNSNVTGSMTLKKGGYKDIDQRHYFRDEVFADLYWENSNDKKPHLEYAVAKFYIVIEGINYGEYELKLKHDPRTDTKSYIQKNSMTHLLWKKAKKLIRNEDLMGKKMKLFKITDKLGEFVIIIE